MLEFQRGYFERLAEQGVQKTFQVVPRSRQSVLIHQDSTSPSIEFMPNNLISQFDCEYHSDRYIDRLHSAIPWQSYLPLIQL